jgi:hypothetical protein
MGTFLVLLPKNEQMKGHHVWKLSVKEIGLLPRALPEPGNFGKAV